MSMFTVRKMRKEEVRIVIEWYGVTSFELG